MTDEIIAALETDRTIDITTRGRRSGRPRRLEIWFHNVDGRIFITGLPGRRDWYANLVADPELTFHLKESLKADLAATARPVTAVEEKREIFEIVLPRIGHLDKIERWLTDSPLVEVSFA
jgi:deazaflavin-dependent oxidoreductase (nitroreductase family)